MSRPDRIRFNSCVRIRRSEYEPITVYKQNCSAANMEEALQAGLTRD